MENYTNTDLIRLSGKRKEEDGDIKLAIKKEFKSRFKKPGEGLDFYSNADTYIYGMLESTGPIGQMFLREDGEIGVTLVQEYEDTTERFEDHFFQCDDWPMLLMLVRDGIENDWLIDDEDE